MTPYDITRYLGASEDNHKSYMDTLSQFEEDINNGEAKNKGGRPKVHNSSVAITGHIGCTVVAYKNMFEFCISGLSGKHDIRIDPPTHTVSTDLGCRCYGAATQGEGFCAHTMCLISLSRKVMPTFIKWFKPNPYVPESEPK